MKVDIPVKGGWGKALLLIDLLSVVLSVIAYVLCIYLCFDETSKLIWLILSTGIPFVLVSVFRKIINAPRPYECGVPAPKGKNKEGCSFPSRHAFSAFCVSVVSFEVICPIAATVLFAFAILLSVSRVLMGKHFVRDVLAGALIGILSGVLSIVLYGLVIG